MATFNFDVWWATVTIGNELAEILARKWLLDSGFDSRDALTGLELQHLQLELPIVAAVKRLGEFSHRYFYHASFILNAAFFCIGV